MGDNDEEVERKRQERDRARLSPLDQLYGPPKVTLAGDDDRRSKRRKGRVFRMPLSMQVRVRAVLNLVLDRDGHDGLPALFEVMMVDYLRKYGGIDEAAIASEEELIRRHLLKRDEKDGE